MKAEIFSLLFTLLLPSSFSLRSICSSLLHLLLLSLIHNKFRMLCAYSNTRMRTFKVWIMRDYNLEESWNAILSIKDRYLLKATPTYRFANGEILFMCARLYRKDIQFRTQRGPFTLLPRGKFQNRFTYTESLISPELLI